MATKADYKSRMNDLYKLMMARAPKNKNPPPPHDPCFPHHPFNFNQWASNYWEAGCMLDTLLDYFKLALDEKWKEIIIKAPIRETINAALETALCHYRKLTAKNTDHYGNKYPPCMYDDAGWWGNLGAKAYSSQYDEVFGHYKCDFQKIGTDCYHFMTYGHRNPEGHSWGAPHVWKAIDEGWGCYGQKATKEHPYGQFSSKECLQDKQPRFTGGLWQYDMFNKKIDKDCIGIVNSGCNPAKPLKASPGCKGCWEGPYQITIVNGLYLMLATRLLASGALLSPPGEELSTILDNLTSFLHKWVDKDPPHQLQASERLQAKTGLIRERVAIYADSTPVEWFDSATFWGGDQGMIMSGLVEYAKSRGNLPGGVRGDWALKIANGIASGVLDQMIDRTGLHQGLRGLMKPWLIHGNTLVSGDLPEYCCGVGVFMRCLLHCYNIEPEIKAMVEAFDPDGQQIYKNMIFAGADASHAGTFPTWGAGNPFLDYFNQMATLVLAYKLKEGDK